MSVRRRVRVRVRVRARVRARVRVGVGLRGCGRACTPSASMSAFCCLTRLWSGSVRIRYRSCSESGLSSTRMGSRPWLGLGLARVRVSY